MVAMDAATTEDPMSFTIIRTYQVKRSTGFVYELDGRRAASFAKSAEALASSLGVKTMTKPMTMNEIQAKAHAAIADPKLARKLLSSDLRTTRVEVERAITKGQAIHPALVQAVKDIDEAKAAYEAMGFIVPTKYEVSALRAIEEIIEMCEQERAEYPELCDQLIAAAKVATAEQLSFWHTQGPGAFGIFTD